MRRVVLLGTAQPPRLALEAGVPVLRAAGVDVEVLMARDLPTAFDGLDIRGCRTLRLPRPGDRAAQGPAARAVATLRWRTLQVLQRCSRWPLRTWRLVREDPRALAALDAADAVVALDQLAAFAAWKASRRTGIPAWNGLSAFVDEVVRPGAP
jgi:hypothetical protein